MALSLHRLLVSLVLGLTALLNTATSTPTTLGPLKTAELSHKSGVLTVELANSVAEQAQGLSDRPSLAPDRGMLFTFATDTMPSFWMKDMNFPIDMIWLSAAGEIKDLDTNVSTSTYPQTFAPKTPVRYVLEVNANYAREHNLNLGDFIHFSALKE